MHPDQSTAASLRKITLGLILVVALIIIPVFYYTWASLLVSVLLSTFILIYLLIAIRNDFAEHIKLEKSLKEKNATLNKFFATISHDLRNPIHGIGKLATYLDETTTPEETAEMGKAVKETALAAGELLEKLLLWARVQSGNYQLKTDVFDIDMLIITCIESLAEAAKLKNITINYKAENHLVMADKETVTFVLKNSIENAIKFSHEGSSITILTEVSKEEVKISVIDNGIGMDVERLINSFNIEYANPRKGTNGEKGYGISLPLCKDFIELNGGKTALKSVENKGTEFHFTLPRLKNQ